MLEGEDGDFKKENNLPIQEKNWSKNKTNRNSSAKKMGIIGMLNYKE